MDVSIWKRFTEKAASVVPIAIFTLIAYSEVYVFASGCFFETNRLLYGYAFASLLLLAVTSALTLYFGVNLYLSLWRRDVERMGTVTFAAELLTVAIGVAIPIILYYARTVESAAFLKTLPYFLAGLAAAVSLLLIPLARKKWYLAFIPLAVLLLTVCGISFASATGDNLSFEAAPVVIDNGEDFSVVWCTDVNSVGYLDYSYGGQSYRLYDAEDGRYLTDKRVHTVHVPYEHLYGNTYTVSAAKVMKDASRDCKLGAFRTSDPYRFADKVTGDELKLLSLTDWHEGNERMYPLAEKTDFDLLLLMGDAINYVNEYDDIVKNIVIPGGKLTGGVKPALFVRGNHEIRGKYSGEIKSVLGMDNYYFTASYDEVNFLVFDGGDSKPDDDARNGVVNVCVDYRDRQLAEMEALPLFTTGYNVCLCHIPLFSEELFDDVPKAEKADEQAERFAAILEKQNVKLEISGHEHILEYVKREDRDILIAGGPTEKDGFVACSITIKEGVASIVAFNGEGTVESFAPISLG